jgi:integrase
MKYENWEALTQKYLAAHAKRWSHTTLRSETYRLRTLTKILHNQSAPVSGQRVYEGFVQAGLSPYSMQTAYLRAMGFLDWAKIENDLRAWAKENAPFKNTYRRTTPSITYQEALLLVESLAEPIRTAAKLLLTAGLRSGEVNTFDGKTVTGKGQKQRDVYTELPPVTVQYQDLYLALKKLGLKPHDLRKLFASEMVRRGANEFQLTTLMGWSNINTALSYVRTDVNSLRKLVNGG